MGFNQRFPKGNQLRPLAVTLDLLHKKTRFLKREDILLALGDTRSGLARASNATKIDKWLQPYGFAEITGRGLRWLRGYSPLRGCSREAALPAAHSFRNGLYAI